ncbi:MAG: ATPase [Deltaproteobacteria bacterium RBG_13_61_14]|nr:MAG: ATPase [Deltaproteobacteria bacterium RBG_13_61_14]
MVQDMQAIHEKVQQQSQFVDKILAETGKVIVGQRRMLERILIGILSNGHILIEGVPGLAKTMTVRTISDCIRTRFQRIQFTPDLLPADLIGTLIFDQRTGAFTPRQGPIFANLILADEINRAPAKVQSALLEAMQERQVTIGDHTYPLPEPFLVMATQNPIEQEGTYPLPEAQVDRFMLKILVGYPDKAEERQIMDRMTELETPTAEPVITPEEIVAARRVVSEIYVDPKIKDYIVDVVLATREPKRYGLDSLEGLIAWGASPRATIYLTMAAKAHAFLRHRGYATPEDIKSIGADVLRHRIIVTYEAEAEELTSEDIVRQVFDHVEIP